MQAFYIKGIHQLPDDEVVVKVALPGIKADEVQINITGEVLTLKGGMKQQEDKKEKAWHIHDTNSAGARSSASSSCQPMWSQTRRWLILKTAS